MEHQKTIAILNEIASNELGHKKPKRKHQPNIMARVKKLRSKGYSTKEAYENVIKQLR